MVSTPRFPHWCEMAFVHRATRRDSRCFGPSGPHGWRQPGFCADLSALMARHYLTVLGMCFGFLVFFSFLVLFIFTGGLQKTKFLATIPRVEMVCLVQKDRWSACLQWVVWSPVWIGRAGKPLHLQKLLISPNHQSKPNSGLFTFLGSPRPIRRTSNTEGQV